MRLQLSLLALLCLGCAAQQLSDAPSRENFYRRGQVSATVIGNYVYIDGGEISQILDGKPPGEQNYASNSVNSTISIDLSKSWTTADVVLRTIDRPWYSKMNQVIWTDREAGHFYVWGGTWIRGRNMTENTLWKFTPDGKGAGTWDVEPAANANFFKGLHQSERSVFVNTNDTGFAIGGIASGWTEKYRASNQVIPGMVAFNMKTKTWQNGTTAFSPFDTLLGGSAEYIPFGPNGLVVVLGGTAHRVDSDKTDEATARHFDFQNLTLFDPQTKQKYWQLATGSIPPSPRIAFCTAGFQNAEGGYEIFLFGGSNARDRFVYDDAYILSLPGFVWTKVPTSPAGMRRSLACVPIGKRQILSIGGTSIGDSKSKGWNEQDPAPQGLLLFDMTELMWKDSYDPNAAAYERPADIKTWYSNGLVVTLDPLMVDLLTDKAPLTRSNGHRIQSVSSFQPSHQVCAVHSADD
ncbi:hypothetical protein N657DRAFT_570082 [Parathielavia appendiculata]|uniref:Kelch repeat protein n=1 Tax=Parathielavia appendiculata TaxID=2587402 RepID=A0AAN6U2M7_9PEZI|nr:hypothetical protein N657DRAFT_570082 [Parathielavia appendiculata]